MGITEALQAPIWMRRFCCSSQADPRFSDQLESRRTCNLIARTFGFGVRVTIARLCRRKLPPTRACKRYRGLVTARLVSPCSPHARRSRLGSGRREAPPPRTPRSEAQEHELPSRSHPHPALELVPRSGARDEQDLDADLRRICSSGDRPVRDPPRDPGLIRLPLTLPFAGLTLAAPLRANNT